MSPTKVAIVGAHGKLGLRLARLLAQTGQHHVTALIRDEAHIVDVKAASKDISSVVLSLEDSPVSEYTKAFQDKDVVIFSAGAGGKGGPERTRKVDYEGAVKVFDAIEAVPGDKPRLILVGSMNSGNPNIIPKSYNEEDIALRKMARDVLGHYFNMKYLADQDLVTRTAFKWTVLRPGRMVDDTGTGKVAVGEVHLTVPVPRDDVALALRVLIDRPDAAGLMINMVGGEMPVSDALDTIIKSGETAWFG